MLMLDTESLGSNAVLLGLGGGVMCLQLPWRPAPARECRWSADRVSGSSRGSEVLRILSPSLHSRDPQIYAICCVCAAHVCVACVGMCACEDCVFHVSVVRYPSPVFLVRDVYTHIFVHVSSHSCSVRR